MVFNTSNGARRLLKELENQPRKFVFGVDQAIFNCVLALITPVPRDGKQGKEWAQAHVYLLDLPGRGKTAVLTFLSAALRAKIGRVDGRPDMLPSDLTGREDVDKLSGIRTLLKGPLHCHIFFFDEINRTPPKGQAILLGAMEGAQVIMNVTSIERRVIEARAFPLYPIADDPHETRMFFEVFATANPIEFEGTYPLSEAQKERFTYSFRMGRPQREDEMRVRAKNVAGRKVEVVMDLAALLEIQEIVRAIELTADASELLMRYIENSNPYSQDLEDYDAVRTRHATPGLVEFVNRYVANGCSVRRNYHMEAAAKAWAFRRGEDRWASVDDVKAIAGMTMEHVLLLQPRSEGDGVNAKKVVRKIIDETMMP